MFSASGPSVSGLVSEVQEPPLSRTWKVEPASGELNANVGVVFWVAAAGDESIVVCGATVSSRIVCDWMPESLATRSKARYLTVVMPSAATSNAPV